MKGHNRFEMDDALDIYVRHGIKNWAAQYQPRSNGRACLLLVAASPASQQSRQDDGTNNLLQQSYRRDEFPADNVIDSYNFSWQWAMRMSFTHIRHVA
jgi:hypothetical protein